jgi:hypothetical protein
MAAIRFMLVSYLLLDGLSKDRGPATFQGSQNMTHSTPIALAFIFLWALIVLVNSLSFYSTHIKKKFKSPVMLVGGLFGLVGFYLIPQLRNWCWVAVLLDYGSVAFLLALPKLIKELWQTSRIRLTDEFFGEEGGRRVSIRLYKAGVLIISHRIARTKDEPGLIASSDIGTWHEADGVMVLTLRNDTIRMRQVGNVWKVDRSFAHYPENRDLGIAGLDFRRVRLS